MEKPPKAGFFYLHRRARQGKLYIASGSCEKLIFRVSCEHW